MGTHKNLKSDLCHFVFVAWTVLFSRCFYPFTCFWHGVLVARTIHINTNSWKSRNLKSDTIWNRREECLSFSTLQHWDRILFWFLPLGYKHQQNQHSTEQYSNNKSHLISDESFSFLWLISHAHDDKESNKRETAKSRRRRKSEDGNIFDLLYSVFPEQSNFCFLDKEPTE